MRQRQQADIPDKLFALNLDEVVGWDAWHWCCCWGGLRCGRWGTSGWWVLLRGGVLVEELARSGPEHGGLLMHADNVGGVVSVRAFARAVHHPVFLAPVSFPSPL